MRISEAKKQISEKLIHDLTNLEFLTMEELKEKLRDESTIAYISSLTDQAFSTLKLENNQLTGKSLPIRLAKIATDFMIAIKDEEQTTHLVLIPYQSDKQVIEGKSYLGLIN